MRAVNDFDSDMNDKKPQPKLREVKIVRSNAAETAPKPEAARPDRSSARVAALVVDDEPANQDFLVRLLRQAKLHVEGASTGEQALTIAERLGDDLALVMLDRKLPDMTGVEVLSKLRPQFPEAKIMMATMFDERSMIREAFKEGADAFLVKPHGFMELFQLVNNCMQEQIGFDCLENQIFDQYGRRQWRGY